MLEGLTIMKDVLKCMLMENGVLSVMMDGMTLMLGLCVDNWDLYQVDK